MKLPPKAVLIRLCIYVPLLTYFGYLACQRYATEQAEERAAPEFDGPRHTFTLPDGKSVEVVEISQDQARQMGFDPGQAGSPPSKAEADAAESPPDGPPGAN